MTTLNLQVGAGADDAYERDDNGIFSSTSPTLAVWGGAAAVNRYNSGMRFLSVGLLNSVVINAATLQGYIVGTARDDLYGTIRADDVDDSVSFVTDGDINGRPMTSAAGIWEGAGLGVGWETSPEIKTVIQEIVDRVGWASGNALSILILGRTTVGECDFRSYNGDSAKAPKLDIDYVGIGSAGHVASARGIMRGVRRGVM